MTVTRHAFSRTLSSQKQSFFFLFMFASQTKFFRWSLNHFDKTRPPFLHTWMGKKWRIGEDKNLKSSASQWCNIVCFYYYRIFSLIKPLSKILKLKLVQTKATRVNKNHKQNVVKGDIVHLVHHFNAVDATNYYVHCWGVLLCSDVCDWMFEAWLFCEIYTIFLSVRTHFTGDLKVPY